jgi:hypothetical protein
MYITKFRFYSQNLLKKEEHMKPTKKTPTLQTSALSRKYPKAKVFADLTLFSANGKSIFTTKEKINSSNVHEFFPPKENAAIVCKILEGMGLKVVTQDHITISISASLEVFQKCFQVQLSIKRYFPYSVPPKQRVSDEKGCGAELFYENKKEIPIPLALKPYVEKITLPKRIMFCESPTPPNPSYHHLKVPEDVARQINAIACHHRGYQGGGIVLAMPDQGTYNHAYYSSRGYNITVDDSAYDQTAETKGHGTAITANALAVAPAVNFIGVRNGSFVSSALASFNRAVEHNPNVITVSWGMDEDDANLRAAFSQAISNGITICCACGNGGTEVFPSSIPEVISVGGAYSDGQDTLQASSYASSGQVPEADPGRQMPDVVGMVGQSPNGVYITLPIEPGFKEDQEFGGNAFPDGDGTAENDGWLVASGTSSATPQVAAAACLLMQKDPTFKGNPNAVKQRLMTTALDVTSGSSASGELATIGSDNATGAGLIDAFVALNLVDLWVKCNDMERGIIPKLGPIYVCPDIKVTTDLLTDPDSQFDAVNHISTPVFGTTYNVYIKVRNRGITAAINVTVGFFYADPCTLISYPEDWMDGQSVNATLGRITVNGTSTNLFQIDHIEAHSSRVAGPFVWTPPDPTIATQVGTLPDGEKYGHFCLLTRSECAQDPIHWSGGDWSSLALDNNLGVRNLTVIEPEIVLPLTFKSVEKAHSSFIQINTFEIPNDLIGWFMTPENMLKRFSPMKDGSKRKLKILRKNTPRGFIQIGVPNQMKIKIDISGMTKTIVKFWIKKQKVKPETIPYGHGHRLIYMTQYADGVEVGGLAVEVR